MSQVVMYSRPGCHLCDIAMETISTVRQSRPFAFTVVDITLDPGLYDRYRYQIPVVCIDGKEMFRHHIDAGAFGGLIDDADGRGC